MPDRRRNRPLRLLFMDVGSFWQRFVRRRAEMPVSRPVVSHSGDPHPAAVHPRPEPAPLRPTTGRMMHLGPECTTGIPAIDAQHQELVDAIHRLQASLKEGSTGSESRQIVAFLTQYADEHFAQEEAYLQSLGYPGLERHRSAHRDLRNQVAGLRSRISSGDPALALDLSRLLLHWLRDHILLEDLAYVEYARSRPEAG